MSITHFLYAYSFANLNKPVKGRAKLLTVPRDLKHYCSAGSIDASEWDFISPDLRNRQRSQTKAPLKMRWHKGHDNFALLRIGGAKPITPRASHARPRTASSTRVIRRYAEGRSSCFPPNAHIYETTTGVVCNFVRLRSTFPNRTAWELTALLTPTAHPGIPGLNLPKG